MGMANKSGTAEIYLQLAEQCAAIEGVYLSAYPEKEIAEAKILTRLTKSKACLWGDSVPRCRSRRLHHFAEFWRERRYFRNLCCPYGAE
jgi:hypothetical protein